MATRCSHPARDHPYFQWTEGPCGRLATDADHITPLDKGGDRYDPNNLQCLCKRPTPASQP